MKINYIEGDNINQLMYQSLLKLTKEGTRTSSRNGDVIALYDTEIILNDPKSIHLNLIGRTNNIFATIAEMFWVMSGDDKIDPFLSFFIPRAPLYSDDGKTWTAAYGDRLYRYNQIQDIIDTFKEDGIMTRRAVASILMPNLDSKVGLLESRGIDKTNDRPCNNWMNFFITPDKKLNMKIQQRSGDIIFGTGNINVPEFSLLQQFILQEVKREVDEDITLGYYHHSVTNLHLYDFNGKQGYSILKNEHDQILGRKNSDMILFPESVSRNQDFFILLVDYFSKLISGEVQTTYKNMLNYIKSVFELYEIETDGNLLYGYSVAIGGYILEKLGQDICIDNEIENFSDEFTESIKNNKFNRIFKIESDNENS